MFLCSFHSANFNEISLFNLEASEPEGGKDLGGVVCFSNLPLFSE